MPVRASLSNTTHFGLHGPHFIPAVSESLLPCLRKVTGVFPNEIRCTGAQESARRSLSTAIADPLSPSSIPRLFTSTARPRNPNQARYGSVLPIASTLRDDFLPFWVATRLTPFSRRPPEPPGLDRQPVRHQLGLSVVLLDPL